MDDIQSLADHRNLPIERVGITKLALPVMILEQGGGFQHVLAEASMFVEVPASVRGTHMSRFVEVLHSWSDRPVASNDIEALLMDTRGRAGSVSAEVDLTFTYFIRKTAPVSGKIGVVDHRCSFRGRMDASGYSFTLGVQVPVTTLCPCSKAISEEGAHNQRTYVDVALVTRPSKIVWIEEVVEIVDDEASCAVFSLLKREDEKWVTERAYRNAKFVEDMVRDVVLRLSSLPDVLSLNVCAESVESIHNHNAYAATAVVVRLEDESVTQAVLSLDEAAIPAG